MHTPLLLLKSQSGTLDMTLLSRNGKLVVVLVQSGRSRGRAHTAHCEVVISRGLMDRC